MAAQCGNPSSCDMGLIFPRLLIRSYVGRRRFCCGATAVHSDSATTAWL
ncbi:hypothetical protein INP83_11870 [Mucilaginibacter sp. 21P]|nr:hypothetical protein [Mucilaginibacter sp. 21P]QXV63803.1 hypothetical protein INP83_11870 [Mucilaginibacter sp. 21P]